MVISRLSRLALIADDSESTQILLKSLLEEEGYDVIAAYDGVEALDAFNQYYPSLVLMDINMPHMDGWQTTKKIREVASEHFVPILFVSACNTESHIIKSIEAGGDDFIALPFSPEIFRAKLKALQRIGDLYRQFYLMQQEQIKDHEIAEQLFNQVIESENIGLDIIQVVKQAATTFSGDVVLTAQGPDGTIHVLLGDFTGHGLKSIVGAFSLSEVFRTMIQKGYTAKKVLSQINYKLYSILPNDMFLACALVSISPNDQVCHVWNGGLPDVLIYCQQNKNVKHKIASCHPPLGILPVMLNDVEDTIVDYDQLDHIVLVSDGIIEARDGNGEMFGEKRLHYACVDGLKRGDIAREVFEATAQFCKGHEQEDDMSLVVVPIDNLKRLPNRNFEISEFDPDFDHAPVRLESGAEVWTWHITLSGQQLAKVNLVPLVMNYVQEIEGKAAHWNNLYTILTELYVNALDHGILNLDSSIKNSPVGFVQYFKKRDRELANLEDGRIEILLVRYHQESGGRISIEIKDSGDGFDVERWLKQAKQTVSVQEPSFTNLAGRGIRLVNSLCRKLEYSENGARVQAEYQWQANEEH